MNKTIAMPEILSEETTKRIKKIIPYMWKHRNASRVGQYTNRTVLKHMLYLRRCIGLLYMANKLTTSLTQDGFFRALRSIEEEIILENKEKVKNLIGQHISKIGQAKLEEILREKN